MAERVITRVRSVCELFDDALKGQCNELVAFLSRIEAKGKGVLESHHIIAECEALITEENGNILLNGELGVVLRSAQEAIVLPPEVALAVSLRPGVLEYIRVNGHALVVEELGVAEYRHFKEELIDRSTIVNPVVFCNRPASPKLFHDETGKLVKEYKEVHESSLLDIELVMQQAQVSRSKAVKALKAADGDIVSAMMELTMPNELRVNDEDDEEGSDGDNEDDMDREVDEGTDVRGKASGDKFYKSEGNEEFHSGAGGSGSSDSGSNAEGESKDSEEEFWPIGKYDQVIKEAEARGVHLSHDVVEAAKSVGIHKSHRLRYLDLQLIKPDEPRADDEDDEEGFDEDNEDGMDREAADRKKYAVKAGEMHGMDNLKGRGKKVRRAGSRRTRAKVAMRKQREAVQPTCLLAGLKNHPSMYIRLGQKLPERHSAFQDTWTSAFEVCSTAAVVYKNLLHEAGFGDFLRIQPFKIRSGGYTSTLVERYFSETHTLHLGTFEIGPTPLAWTMITGITFGGDPLNPPDITTQECAKLLGGMEEDFSFIKGKLDLNVLCPSGLDFSKNPTDSDREWMFRRLIVYLVGSCFFSGTDSMIPIRLVSAMSNIRKINQYDWGAATFSAFLRGMRQKTSECCGAFSGFYPFLLLWAYEHIPYMRPLAKSGADTFPLACRWDFTQKDVPIPNDFIWHRLELEYIDDEVNFDPYKELWKKKSFTHERALSRKRVAFLGLESWELYMGERNVRQFGGGIRIPRSLPAKRFCERSKDFTIDQKLLLGVNAWFFLEDVGCDYAEWFRANSLGRIVALDQFQGRILGGRLIELWLRVHRDGYKVISPQDLQTLKDGAKRWEDEYQIAEAKLKKNLAKSNTLREDVNHWKQVGMSLAAERDFWQSQASDAKARLTTNLVPYPTQTSLFHPQEMVPFPQGYMNAYYGDAQNSFMRLH